MILELLLAGFNALKDYIAAHVLTCLVPAFLLAGAMVSFVDREAVLDLLGERARKLKSFPLTAVFVGRAMSFVFGKQAAAATANPAGKRVSSIIARRKMVLILLILLS